MANKKSIRNIFLAVAAIFLTVASFAGCDKDGKESADSKNETSGGAGPGRKTDGPGAAEREAGIAALEKKDHEEAMKKFRAGAEKGDPDAMLLYAICLDRDYGTGEKDDAAVEEWLKKAAETGDPLAQAHYGNFLMEHRKKSEGLAYLRKSADGGSAFGQFTFGMACMDEGDYAKGLANLKKAASQPLTDKKSVLDYVDDVRSYKEWSDFPFELDDEHLTNANLAVVMSQVMLGLAYHAGVATGGRDLNEAKKWLEMARDNGCREIDEWLEELEKENK